MDNSNVQTLNDFIRYGFNSSYTTQSMSFFHKDNDIVYLDKFVYQKYERLFKAASRIVILTDDELNKYRYNPEALSTDLYGTPNLYHLILYLNRCSTSEFKRKNVILISPKLLQQLLQKVIEHEQKNLTKSYKTTL